MLSYPFMVNAFAASGIVAIVAGIVGFMLVLRGQAFAGHALAHVGFTGATGAVLIGVPPLWGLVVVTMAGGFAMGLLGARAAGRDVAIGMVLSIALGLGLLFLHFFTAYATQATALLFGNVLAVDPGTVWSLAAIGVVCLGAYATIARKLLFATVQPELAAARGVDIRAMSVAFLGIVALATAGCAQIVGVLLVFALMVGPAATALTVTTGFWSGTILSAALALFEAWSGLILAYETDWPTSFWITALGGILYVAGLGLQLYVSRSGPWFGVGRVSGRRRTGLPLRSSHSSR